MNNSDFHIKIEDDSIVLLKEESLAISFRVSEIESIKVYKRDLVTEDLICMEFTTENSSYELNEEMKGWDDFVKALPDVLKNCDLVEKWFPKVTQTPFEADEIEIYSSNKLAL